MSNATGFSLNDREMSAEPLHYTMCGLNDIYLLNGFKRHTTPYGTGVAVEKADALHMEIGDYLIKHRKVLGPKDVKFLRKNMNFTQEDLARCLGVTSQTVARYEKGSTEISGPADRMIRLVYAFHLLPEEERARVMEELMEAANKLDDMDETGDDPVYFGNTPLGWDQTNYDAFCIR